jgi:Na+/H+-dicarboxylate symporter
LKALRKILETVALRGKHLFKEPIVWLLMTLVFCLSCYSYLPEWFVRGALTVSIILKGLLMFFLPLLILSGTAIAFSSLRGNSLLFIGMLLGMILISNFTNLMVSAIGGCCIIPRLLGTGEGGTMQVTSSAVMPFFNFNLPQPLPAVWALVIGISSGIADASFGLSQWMKIVRLIRRFTMWFLIKIFIRFLPLFLMGFVLKLLLEGQMSEFLKANGAACLVMVVFIIGDLAAWWFGAHKLSGVPAIALAKNIFPATATGMSTMSSMAALPFSIEAASKNTKDPTLANAVMPVTINFHMVGDTIIVPILTVMVLSGFGYAMPGFVTFVYFGLLFILNKFAGAGIPGGSVMVSLPILERLFGFTPEMLAMITTFYMLLDPIATAANVTANNFFVLFIQKVWKRIGR